MKTRLFRFLGLFFAILMVMAAMPVNHSTLLADPLVSRSPWEMNLGEGLQIWGSMTPYHGYEGEYDYATIPSADDPNWYPAPDADIIGFSEGSTLCGVCNCRWGGQFTYFRTFVDIASNVEVTEFTIATSGVDDGIRVTIFNSSYPSGLVVPGSYVFLGGSGTADLKDYVVSGEANTVIITHVDDCCSQSYLNSASIVLNGEIVLVPLDIEIDIKPGSYPNSINLGSRGVVPVAVLTTDEFDASTVDPVTVVFAGAQPLRWALEDVDYDGDLDLIFHFKTQELDLDIDSTEATLTGDTFDGMLIVGTDTVNIVP